MPAFVNIVADFGRGAPCHLNFGHAISADGFDCFVGRLGEDHIIGKQAVNQFIGSVLFPCRIGVGDLFAEFAFIVGFDLVSKFSESSELGNVVMVGQQVVDDEFAAPFRFRQIPPGIHIRAIRQQLVVIEPLGQFPIERETGSQGIGVGVDLGNDVIRIVRIHDARQHIFIVNHTVKVGNMNQVSAFDAALIFGHDLFLDNIGLHVDNFGFDAGEIFHECSQSLVHAAGNGIDDNFPFLFGKLIELLSSLGTVIDIGCLPGFIGLDRHSSDHADEHGKNNKNCQFFHFSSV